MDADVLVAGSEDGQVRLWDIASGAVYSLFPAEPGYEAPYALDGMKVLLAGTRPRLLLTQHRDRVAIWDWDVSDPGQLTSRQQTEIGTMRGSDLHVARGVPLLATLDHADQVSVVELLSGRRLFGLRCSGPIRSVSSTRRITRSWPSGQVARCTSWTSIPGGGFVIPCRWLCRAMPRSAAWMARTSWRLWTPTACGSTTCGRVS
jgi:WD40 repeat protein